MYCGAYASEDVTSAVTATGQTFILNNTTVTVGTAAEPAIQISENGTSAITIIHSTSYCSKDVGFVYWTHDYSDADILVDSDTPVSSSQLTVDRLD